MSKMSEAELSLLHMYRDMSFLYFCVYSDNLTSLVNSFRKEPNENCFFLKEEFLLYLKYFIDYNKNTHILNKMGIENIQEMIRFIRENTDKSDTCRYDELNEMLVELNSIKNNDGYEKMKEDEISRRVSNLKVSKNVKYGDSYCLFKNFFITDTVVIDSFSFNDEKFESHKNVFINNELFIYTINRFMMDIPFVFKNDDFYERVLEVVSLNKIAGRGITDHSFRKNNSLIEKKVKKLKKGLDSNTEMHPLG